MLNDGKWHKLAEIQRMVKADEDSIQRIVEFLSKYECVTVDQTEGKMKLSEVAMFLARTSTA
jgi:hypothetical protein